ncbi:hypothetical protein VTO73DRAFT_10951 [Trametes versicolor]
MSPSPRANATDGVLQIAAERFHGLSRTDGRGSLGAVQIRRPRANIGVGEVVVQNNSASFSDESVPCLEYRK